MTVRRPVFSANGGLVEVPDTDSLPRALLSLTPAATLTSSGTVAANTIVPVDTTSAAVTATLPSAPADKTQVLVVYVIQGGTNAVTITCGGTDVFNRASGATSLTLERLNQSAWLQYNATSGIWYQLAGVPDVDDVFRPSLRLPKWVAPSSILTEFQTSHGYTANGQSASNLNDTTAANFIKGTQSASVTSAGTGAQCNLQSYGQPSMDLTGKMLRVTLMVDDITHLSNVYLYLGTSSMANFFVWSLQTTSATNSNYIQSGQWVTITLGWADVANTGGSFTYSGGSPSTKSGFTDIRLKILDDNTGNPVTVHWQSIEIIPDGSVAFPNGVVSIAFDDSWQSAYDLGRPKLDQYGYAATMYAITDLVGTSGKLTATEILNLQDRSGWEVSAHAYQYADHQLHDTGMTAAQLDADARAQKAWLVENGFRGEGHAYPGGSFGLTADGVTTRSVLRKYFAYGRTILYTDTLETFPPADPFKLRSVSGVSSLGTSRQLPANITGSGTLLDKIKNNQGWLILTFHNIVTSSPATTTDCLQSDFNAIIDAINSRGMPVLPVGDVLGYYAATDIASTTIAPARLGSGTASSSTFLRGDSVWATPSGVGGGVDVQVFTSSGTWTKPAGVTVTTVTGIGPGGAGGSGPRQASGTALSGGGGGGGGGWGTVMFRSADLGSTETVTIGSAGTGGASVTTDSTNGNAGGGSTSTTFGTTVKFRVGGGGAGSAGGTSSSTAGVASSGGMSQGSAGAACVAGAAGANGANGLGSAGGGGAGGGITAGGSALAGGNGGAAIQLGGLSTSGGAINTSGGAGPSATTNTPVGGGGGAGGGSSVTGTAGSGGAGGNYGAGGGGGGAALNGNASGAGGNGGPSILIVVSV